MVSLITIIHWSATRGARSNMNQAWYDLFAVEGYSQGNISFLAAVQADFQVIGEPMTNDIALVTRMLSI